MKTSMRVKIKNKFTNPLTGRKILASEEVNVPRNQFWLKRLAEKACELVTEKNVS